MDNFHTAFNLGALLTIRRYGNGYDEVIKRVFDYYIKDMFLSDGTPKYYSRLYPIDIQCASQSIETFTFFSSIDISSLELAKKWRIGQ